MIITPEKSVTYVLWFFTLEIHFESRIYFKLIFIHHLFDKYLTKLNNLIQMLNTMVLKYFGVCSSAINLKNTGFRWFAPVFTLEYIKIINK